MRYIGFDEAKSISATTRRYVIQITLKMQANLSDEIIYISLDGTPASEIKLARLAQAINEIFGESDGR